MMKAFAVSGFSFSGKTFLLEQLISHLIEEGFTVATVKNTMEDQEEPEGTDTWRHAQSGSNPTILVGPSSATIRIKGNVSFLNLTKIFDSDFLLLEGFKELDVPRFWCVGTESKETDFKPTQVKAIVVWEGENYQADMQDIPVVSNSKISLLTDILKREAIDVNSLNGRV